MRANKHGIHLERCERWIFPSFDASVGYDKLTELYWQAEDLLWFELNTEFKRLEAACQAGQQIEDALRDPMVARPESTMVAEKMYSLHCLLINYVDDGFND